MFVRIHKAPKKALTGRFDFGRRDAKAQYYFEYSVQRYCKDPDQKRLFDDLMAAMKTGEIGRVESVRFVVSDSPG